MNDTTLVVVGAGLAGIRACEAARGTGHRGSIVLIGEEPHLPYDRPPLSKDVLTSSPDRAIDVQLRSAAVLEDELAIDVRTGTRVTGIDVYGRGVHTDCGDLPYDELIIATGAAARQLPEAQKYSGIFPLRTLDDSRQVRQAVIDRARIVVVGAGFIGSEVASAARAAGLGVTVVESGPAPLVRSLGPEIGRLCAELHHRHGTDLRLNTTLTAVHPADGAKMGADGRTPVGAVELSDGSTVDTDVVVAGIGAVPSTSWLEDSGVLLDKRDHGVICTPDLAVMGIDGDRIPHLWAAGDVAHWPNPQFDRVMRLEHWTNAAEQGAVAARNALAEPAGRTPYSTVPYFWSDWYGTRIQFVGVPEADEMTIQHRRDNRGGTVALYRADDRLVGALTIGRPDLIMKYRRLIAQRASWRTGVDFGAVAC